MSVKATDVPQLAGVRAEVDDLPSDRDAIFNGERTIRYHDRTFPGLRADGDAGDAFGTLDLGDGLAGQDADASGAGGLGQRAVSGFAGVKDREPPVP